MTGLLALLAVATWILMGIRPDPDGDVWWHMAYGRQLLESRTLRIDHSIFTWTPASSQDIYCAWLPEILLFLAYQTAGLAALFAARYALLAVVPLLGWILARQLGVDRHPLFGLALLLSLLMSVLAVTTRPQSISHVMLAAIAFVWRQLHRRTPNAGRLCYVLPVLIVIWVNCHGAFVFGLVLLGIIGIGEELNALYAPRLALPLEVRRHLFPALVLSVLATLANPYGVAYPLHVVAGLMKVSGAHLASVSEYQSLLGADLVGLHLDDLGLVSLAILVPLVVLSIRREGLDWPVLLAAATFFALYVRFLRSSIFWPPLFIVLVITLLARTAPRARALAPIGLAVALLLFGRFAYDCVAHPMRTTWLGFGVCYRNPIEEAEFIDRHLRGRRLGNDYDTGAYLLWRLWPHTKTFIDPRYFPFADWYDEYRKISTARGIEDALRRFPCDAWCIGVGHTATLRWFLASPDWKPAFYGASAVIFVQKGRKLPFDRVQSGAGISEINELTQALNVLLFAVNLGDWSGAGRILAGMESNWRFLPHRGIVSGARICARALEAYGRRDYTGCLALLDRAEGALPLSVDTAKAASSMQVSRMHWERKEDAAALTRAEAALALWPDDPVLLFNAGVIRWQLSAQGHGPDGSWRPKLERFLERGKGRTNIPDEAVRVARAILAGTYSTRPPLLSATL